MKINKRIFYIILLIIAVNNINCTGSKNNSYAGLKYQVTFIDNLSFTDYIFFELKENKSELIKYAVTHKAKNSDSLEIHYDLIKLRKNYFFDLYELENPIIIRSRVLSFYYRNGVKIWENDTFKTQIYSIENAVDKFILPK